jgi:hypothetical protein
MGSTSTDDLPWAKKDFRYNNAVKLREFYAKSLEVVGVFTSLLGFVDTKLIGVTIGGASEACTRLRRALLLIESSIQFDGQFPK